jgi:mycofactocin biosynthesis protein MftB
MACAASTESRPGSPPDAVFELDRPWRVDPQVALRAERFGALAYHYGTRRLSFLKSRRLLEVVESLDRHSSARAACLAASVDEDALPGYERALTTLAQTGMIRPRGRA